MGARVRISQAGRSSPVFLSAYNLLNLLRQTGELCLIAMAMTILISLGSSISPCVRSIFSEGDNIERTSICREPDSPNAAVLGASLADSEYPSGTAVIGVFLCSTYLEMRSAVEA